MGRLQLLDSLAVRLNGLDGRGYKAYKSIAGHYEGEGFLLFIDHVQGDPFAEPSRVRVRVPRSQLPSWALQTLARRISTADFLNRKAADVFHHADTRCGSGKSGELTLLRPGQQVLARTSGVVDEDGAVELRFRVGLPANGRRIKGRAAARLLSEQLPQLVMRALRYDPGDESALRQHVFAIEDAQALRARLADAGLVAFVGDGAVLPRRSGIDDRPLGPDAVAFESAASLRVTLPTPNSGDVTGMGIPAGITLIVGGGYHGKSTLLRAIERGVYDHIPGDGRERVVSVADAVKIRAEDGRRVERVDISAFINNLPGGQDTTSFSSENASGSTSQAAAISEALEVGARCLLLDEDTSATNFMIRDARMQRLVAAQDEPITPFIDRVSELSTEHEVSTILVVGGAGDYFDVADTVIAMRSYVPDEVTARAKQIATDVPDTRLDRPPPLAPMRTRVALPDSVNASRGRREVSIKTFREDRVQFGEWEVELGGVEQIVERAQTKAMAEALVWGAHRFIDGHRSVSTALREMCSRLDEDLDAMKGTPVGDFAAFRVFELAAFLNRLRSLRVASA